MAFCQATGVSVSENEWVGSLKLFKLWTINLLKLWLYFMDASILWFASKMKQIIVLFLKNNCYTELSNCHIILKIIIYLFDKVKCQIFIQVS